MPTPGEPSDGAYASYVPHDLSYSAEFEDSLISAVLSPIAKQGGIRVISEDSDEQTVDGESVRVQDVSLQSLPSIAESELPIPLEDARRVFASPVPGIKLTHPGGFFEGGPGLDSDMDTFPDDFLSRYPRISSLDDLRKAISAEVEASVAELKDRLAARQMAKEKNEQIEKELKVLVDQHNMELKMQRRIAEENQRKREAREKKKAAREGGG